MAKFEPKPFGKYFLTDRIAIGGMAEIYKAKTFGVDGFEKILAIKKILTHYSSDKEFITMLSDEAKLVVNLSHANIVQVYDLGRVGNDYFISMEFIDGINLRDLIEKSRDLDEPIPIDIAIYIVSEVCRGLDYAHNKKDTSGSPLNIIHRDISPQNILVSYDGGVKIVDFGIAKAALNLSQTHAGILKGKVNYMAPEQAFGKPMDGRSDLFSLGIVLYELLTNKRLYFGETQMEILKQIRNKKINEASFEDDVPDFLKPVLAKVLAYATNKRHETAADLQIELTRILYATYNDFTPRRLIDLLHRWFADRKEHAGASHEPDEGDTVLVSATQHDVPQVNLVHHQDDPEATVQQALVPDPIQEDAISPDDALSDDYFKEPPEEATEKAQTRRTGKQQSKHDSNIEDNGAVEHTERTESSEVTQPLESLEDMLDRVEVGRYHKHQRTTVMILIFFVLLFGLGFYVYAHYQHEILSFLGTTNQKTVMGDETIKPPLQPEDQSVTIQSEPPGAQIWLNGTDTNLRTPSVLHQLKLKTVYQVKVVREGFQEREQKFILFEKREEPISFTMVPQETPAYTLTVVSNPGGAEILVNGIPSGFQTPHVITSLEVGKKYLITVSKDGYLTNEQEIVNNDQGDKSIDITLSALPKASLVISSQPEGATIYLGGEKTAFETPHTVDALDIPQKILITLKKQGYEDAIEAVVLTAAKEYPVGLTLNKIPVIPTEKITTPHNTSQTETTSSSTTTSKTKDSFSAFNTTNSNLAQLGKLRIDSRPAGASVSINGTPKGITPMVVGDLPKNTALSVTVLKKGYSAWSRTVRLSQDRLEINAILAP